ncbi:ABC transporter permease [Devosia faecipullorum]|uniref:ABC transporter permease n=1 Tax=Devosia faecipullorum TaxID=2755039 RepID=UPI00187BAEE5|nr:ABC transporter permease [Devosia faecipullorum]MBE7733181.1 ABC transporter permease [Devosia faecipullorum]
MKIALYRLIFLAGLIALWWLASTMVERNLVPSPWATLLAARQLIAEGRLAGALFDSISIYLSGYAVAILVGIPIGLIMGTMRTLGKTVEVFVYALSATPRVAFIPLIIVFLGLGPQAKILIIFLGAVMPILINTYAGALNSDQELIEMARSVGARRRRIFGSIILPGAVPFILVGLRVGATIGLINTVVAELYTAVKGLGGLLAIYGNTFRMAEYFVIVLTLALIGVVVTEALRFLEIRLGRWRRSDAIA